MRTITNKNNLTSKISSRLQEIAFTPYGCYEIKISHRLTAMKMLMDLMESEHYIEREDSPDDFYNIDEDEEVP
jgi:hypothetical protein